MRIEYISEVVEIANARNITLTSDQITRHMDKLKKTQESQSQQIAEKKVVDIKRTETEEQLTSNQ